MPIKPLVPLAFKIIAFCLILVCGTAVKAQVVFENPKHQVYQFLSRQAQKGNMEITDFMLPLSRNEIAKNLAHLQDSVHQLSIIEQKELMFYQQEFSEFDEELTDSTTFLKKDQHGRLRALTVKKDAFILRLDPAITLETEFGNHKNLFRKGVGLQFWGHASKHITFQAYFQDITEEGTGLDSLRLFTPENGIVRTENAKPNTRSLNYSSFKGNITYSWKNGSVSAGQDQLQFGYGENGRIILSNKAPSYPFIRMDYQPLKWLRFNYSHSWLHSGIIDSNATYFKGNTVYGPNREIYVQKFMATHSLNFFPLKGLALSMGESIVYSDRLDIGYLMPLMFFKAYDQYASKYKITTGSNGQFFFQASSRNHLKNTHFYSALFIDEIRLASIFNSAKSRNQIGFNIGASITDVLTPYLTIGAEYTRINPFVYQNLIGAQTYTSQNYPLGDWMGNNADRVLGFIKYTPLPRLKTSLQFQRTRKGGIGSLEDQYFKEPQPSFLTAVDKKNTRVQFRVSYEYINSLTIQAAMLWDKENNITEQKINKNKQFNLGLNFGF